MDLLRVAVGLVIVFVLLGALHYYSKRLDQRPLSPLFRKLSFAKAVGKVKTQIKHEPLRVFQRKVLTASHQVHVLSFGNEELLICTHPQGCTLISNRSKSGAAFSQVHVEQTGESRLAN